MKKTEHIRIFLMCLLLLAIYPNAYSVTFTSQYNFDGSFDIYYEGQLPVGVALKITLPGGLTTDYTNVVHVNPYYNFFPDYAYQMPPYMYQLGDGHPLAFIEQAGSLYDSVSTFCVSMAGWMPYAAYDNVYYDETTLETILSGPIGNLPTYDLNQDGLVDISDILLFSENWLYLAVPDDPLSFADFNGDGYVDMRDLGEMNGQQYLDRSSEGLLLRIYANNFSFPDHTDYGPVQIELDELRGGIYEVPEPATMLLLGLGGLLLRKKH